MNLYVVRIVSYWLVFVTYRGWLYIDQNCELLLELLSSSVGMSISLKLCELFLILIS